MGEWKDIRGYEGLYQISNSGEVKSLEKTWISGKNLVRCKPETLLALCSSQRYDYVNLYKNGKRTTWRVHHLVWDAFGDKPRHGTKLQVDHIDGDKTNNNIHNLQLLVGRENVAKGFASKRDLPTGVCYHIQHKLYQAYITINKKRTHLGYYDNPLEASQQYEYALADYRLQG